MKKVLAFALVVTLAVCMVPAAFAGGIGGVNPKANPLYNPAEPAFTMNSGASYSIPLGYSAFTSSDAAPVNFGQVSQAQLSSLQLSFADTAALQSFNNLFTYQFELRNANTANPWVYLVLTAKDQTQDTPFSFQCGLYSKVNNIVTATATANFGKLSGKILKKPDTQPIPGFSGASPPQYADKIQPGGTALFALPSSPFLFAAGVTPTVTLQQVTDYGMSVRSYHAGFTAKIVQSGGIPYIEVLAGSGLASGTYETSIMISGSRNSLATLGERVACNLTLTVPGGSIGSNRITGINPDARLGYDENGIWGQLGKNGRLLGSDESPESLLINGNDEITLEFNSDFFQWRDGAPSPATWVTSNAIRNGKITAKVISGRSSNVLDSAEIRYSDGRAYVRVKFVERFVSTKERDFSFTVGLAYNGSVIRDTAITLSGTIENPYTSVYDGDDYVDLSYGDVAYAEDSIKSIEVDLGEGVIIIARLNKGKKYYGTANTDVSSYDQDLMDKYRDIDMVYNLETVGFNSTGNTVRLDAGRKYYVYNKQLEYLGTTDQKLPYSTKYYLATKQLDIAEEEGGDQNSDAFSVPEIISGDYEVQVPATNTPGTTPQGNANDNPINGR